MKKKWICLMASLLLSLSISYVSMHYTGGISQRGKEMVREVEEKAKRGEWDGAAEKMGGLREYWEETEGILQVMICHQDADAVRRAILEVESALGEKKEYETKKGCALLCDALDHLHHRDDEVFSNIL